MHVFWIYCELYYSKEILITVYLTSNKPIGGLTKDLVEYLPSGLKIIVTSAVGYDPFDVVALGARGISVCNSPGLAANPVADHVLYVTLGLYHYSPVFENLLRQTKNTGDCRAILQSGLPWNNEIGRPVLCRVPSDSITDDQANIPVKPVYGFGDKVGNRFVRQPRGHVAGIAGLGAIGKEIGARLNSIGMNVCYHNRTRLNPDEEARLGYAATYYKSFEDMLPNIDLLILSLPINDSTKHIVNENTLALLPQGSKIVNIGRGGLIDTRALIQSLKTGEIHGAALDVFEKEPIVEEELCDRWDVILTPHTGSSTQENVLGAEKICIDNLLNFFYKEDKLITIVNKAYLSLK